MSECRQCEGLGFFLQAKRCAETGAGYHLFMAKCLVCSDDEKFNFALRYATEYGHEPPEEEMRAFGNEPGKIILFAKPGKIPNPHHPLRT